MRLTGYADKFSVHPGELIRFYVNCDGPSAFRAEIVEMVLGDTNPRGPGFIERPVPSTAEGVYPGRRQTIASGSYGFVPDNPLLAPASFTLQCWIWPTTPRTDPHYWRHGPQGILTKWSEGQGYGLFLDAHGHVELRVGTQSLRSSYPLRDHAWHFVAASYDAATGKAVLHHEPQIVYALDPPPAPVEAHFPLGAGKTTAPLLLAAFAGAAAPGNRQHPSGHVTIGHYNGKIDGPRLASRALSRLEIEFLKAGAARGLTERTHAGPTPALAADLVAAWDFSIGIPTLTATDAGPFKLDATLVNCPLRAVTGHNWQGENFDWKHARDEYGAIHFHDDDLDDARWEESLFWEVPATQESRSYALKLTTSEGDEDYVPFWVVARLGSPAKKIGVMIPTISYMAYANEHMATNGAGAELLSFRVPIMQDQNLFLAEHREYGASQYDVHTDGSGNHFSTRLRPILSMRPKYDSFIAQAPWQYPADLHLIYWLDVMGYDYEVFTDEDLTYEGLSRLSRYNVVLTGSHPEHNSGPQIDALHDYTQRGGRLMYLGGDGWYWVQTYHPGYDHLGRGVVTELRRCESGIRGWQAGPGEYYHQSTGELGGMWRFRGRNLHAVAGAGMAAQGFDVSTYFTRTPDSLDPRIAWAFEGIGYEEKLGNFGLCGGGAAGLEVDIIDTMLGSPPHTLGVATSAGRHTEAYLLVMEYYGLSQPGIDGTQHPRVRADLAFHETPNGGACFAFSSIAYCGSLPWNEGRNNISRLTKNVLDRFMQDGPLPPPPPEAIKPRGRADYDPAALRP
ncbi:N,N-dimethylformamidase [Arboricoccus pini]|uniref:N,N-dimethylformamidase n=1 Tax=Arboricoccus pini TaxID=1963835 RepID=A0A212S1D8_9PROT|nr:N,N-dimethylformamidase beta subunit family domain-containing protein [Arboricoccus pini]SNB78804.1 N,N-dimethylformamidase [Arboricoccus pini]